ncbi:uncharacterized protein LOC129766083 [Toxorhynchites rutilus septentrionalis]|uniref:uncharacterized protein LOC129766083 n=1 Tax=Toxorhynchites rutilus septentrionalis TaxID=329112 RepID=UPI002478FD66|nr:uncharacterized protein LOC129766083 [Toxorhynchites rutilus septentrionalis]
MLVADIEKMFRQVNVCPDDRRFQSILWRTSPDQPLKTYELTTITYGTKPAPFLATRALVQLALDEAEAYPLASKVVSEDFYTDDTITGADDPDSAKRLRIQLQQMLLKGGFKLRKFTSNFSTTLDGLPKEDLAIQCDEINLDPQSTVKTLGLIWMPGKDVFRYRFEVNSPPTDMQYTKRKILSIIASLFDSLGLIGAVIVWAKIFMQLLWRLKGDNNSQLSWDDTLPPRIENEWMQFQQHIPLLNDLRVERFISLPRPVSMQIHMFSDASEKAFGSCAYLRTADANGAVKVALMSSKSRVAPLKTQSIPRLELCGALLSAELFESVLQ